MGKRPNIIIFITDQQNADTLKPESKAKTPNVDEFRKDAVVFDSAYTVAPHCCPSRAASGGARHIPRAQSSISSER